MNYEEHITKINQIRFKTSMLRSSLCDCSDAYIPVKRTITVANSATQAQANNGASKKVILKKIVLHLLTAQVDVVDVHKQMMLVISTQ